MRKFTRPILLKFMLIFAITIVSMSVILGFAMNLIVQRYIVDSKTDEIKSVMGEINDVWTDMRITYHNALAEDGNWASETSRLEFEASENNLMSTLELYKKSLGQDAVIIISEIDGFVKYSYPLLPNSGRYAAGRDILPRSIFSHLDCIQSEDEGVKDRYFFKNAKQYASVLETNDYVENTGDYYGLFSDTGTQYESVALKLSYIDPDTGKNVVGGVLVVSISVPSLVEARNNIILYFSLGTILSVIIEILVLSIATKKITDPIRELEDAAARVSKGDFTAKIEVSTNDEIGSLVQTFNEMEDSLASLDQMKNDFIANVSHELRTPMTSIGGFIDAILDGVVPEGKQEHYLTVVRDEIKRLSSLVNELLDIARLQSGKIKLNFTDVNLSDMLSEVIEILSPAAEEKGVKIVANFASDTEYADVDAHSMERVFINLIQNATKFTQTDGTITVHLSSTESEVQIDVEDTGIGIKPEDLKHIFDRFYKGDKSRGLDKTGTGLGLALCKNIVEAHNGTISAESEFGKGTTFIVKIPRKHVENN